MVKAKKGKNNKKPASSTTTNTTTNNTNNGESSSSGTTGTITTTATNTVVANNNNSTNNTTIAESGTPSFGASSTTTGITGSGTGKGRNNNSNNNNGSTSYSYTYKKEDLDDLNWLRECEMRQSSNGDPLIQLEYSDDDELMIILRRFLEESTANTEVIDAIYQIWQQTVLSTLLQSSAIWKKENVTQRDQKHMKDTVKISRLKIHFIIHHVIGHILLSNMKKWITIRDRVLDMCYNTLQLLPRLVESCQHHPTDLRLVIIHYEGKEFLANVACETWDTLYDYSIPIDIDRFIPVLRRCAMLDILDKDWNMLGGWDDILHGFETKCCNYNNNSTSNNNNNNTNNKTNGSNPFVIKRLPSDYVLHETTTILRNARNSMQCKFFSVRFMRYTDDQAPQRYKYYPKCTAPACSNIETPCHIHPYRCMKCWYFHYCSASCQEYCENIMSLHSKFCTDTPKAKAYSCQKETEQYLGWQIGGNTNDNDENDNDDTDDDLVILSKMVAKTALSCHVCGVPDENMSKMTSSSMSLVPPSTSKMSSHSTTSSSSSSWHNTIKMKRCVQCQSVCYCSRQCQEWDWKVGGHRDICKSINTTTTTTATNTTPGTNIGSTTMNNSNQNHMMVSTIKSSMNAETTTKIMKPGGSGVINSNVSSKGTATYVKDLN